MSTVYHALRGRTRYPGFIDDKVLLCWKPPNIASCVLWLDQTTGLWQDSAQTVPADADTDPVWTWSDGSGCGNHMQQGTVAYQPLLQTDVSGTIDAVEFDGTNDWLETAAVLCGSSNATVFLVVYLSSNAEKGAMFGVGWNDANGWAVGVGDSSFDNTGNDLIILYNDVRWIDTGDLIGTGLHVLAVRLVSGVPEWWIDGVASGSSAGSAPNAPTWVTSIGRPGWNGRYYTDHLCEVVLYSTAISDANVAIVNAYLKAKYGI